LRSVATLVALVALAALSAPPVGASGDDATVQATVKVNPILVRLLAVPDRVSVGRPFVVLAIVTNQGRTQLREVEVDLHFDATCLDVRGDTSRDRARLNARGLLVELWLMEAIRAGPECATTAILVTVRATDVDGERLSMESTTHIIEIRQGRR
jgi:hypothetical protein